MTSDESDVLRHVGQEAAADNAHRQAKPSQASRRPEEGPSMSTRQASGGVRTTRRALIIAGGLVMGYAAFGATTDPGLKLGGVLLFLVVVLAGHDGVFMPIVIAAGTVMSRAGHLIRAAALVSLSVAVVALPFVLGYGRSSDNPSALPLSYGLGLILVLAFIWTITLAALLVRRLRRIRQNTVRIQKPPQAASDG